MNTRDDLKFRIGVLGATGYIGTPYRSEIRECGDQAAIVALCARRRDRLDRAAAEDGADLVTDDWRQVLDHPEVNLVVVATPDALHVEPVLECARRGLHVVCEKPIGKDVREAQAMCQAVLEAKVANFVPYWTRYVSVFRRAKQIVESGELGTLRVILYRWHNPRPENAPFTWRDDATVSSAGSIADVGSHAYDIVRWICGINAVRVSAHATFLTESKPYAGDIDLAESLAWPPEKRASAARPVTAFDYAAIHWELEQNVVGGIVLSHASSLRKGLAPELELHGTRASLAVDRVRGRLCLAGPDEECRDVLVEPHVPVNRFQRYVFPAMRDQLQGRPADFPGLEDGLATQRFTDAAAESARSNRWVDL